MNLLEIQLSGFGPMFLSTTSSGGQCTYCGKTLELYLDLLFIFMAGVWLNLRFQRIKHNAHLKDQDGNNSTSLVPGYVLHALNI